MAEQRLIDADAIVKKMVHHGETIGDYTIGLHEGIDVCRKLVDNAPTVDPGAHGEWIIRPDEMACSNCGELWNYCDNDTDIFAYCPRCGAKNE